MKFPTERICRPGKLFMTSAAAAAIALGASTAAFAQPTVAYTNEPIQVQHFSVNVSSRPLSTWGGNQLDITGAGNVSISFVNVRNVAATRVEFALREGKSSQTIVDKGTFSPGTSITHEFSVAPDFYDPSALDVVRVTFADGTSWERG